MHPDSPISDQKARFLRQHAENSLRSGSAPSSGGPLDGDALTLLYEMASDPARSSDALRLLQELQVYQVELDLQWAQLDSNEHDMSRELATYRALFALTPTASLVVCDEGHIVEANPAAARLFGAGQDDLAGRRLLDFLKPDSRLLWTRLLQQLQAGERATGCDVLVNGGSDELAATRLSVSVAPGDEKALLLVASGEPGIHDSDHFRPSP